MALQERFQQVVSRRALLRGFSTGAFGLAGAALLGCTPDTKSTGITGKPEKTPEAPVSKVGVLSMGNFQFEAQDWQELDYQPNPYGKSDKIFREGWKYAAVKGRLRNIGNAVFSLTPVDFGPGRDQNGLAHARRSADFDYKPDSNSISKFSFLSDDGNRYPTTLLKSTDPIPPGFSTEFTFAGWVPQIKNSYSLEATPGSKIAKGNVVKDSPLISADTKVMDINQSWNIPTYGSVSIKGFSDLEAWGKPYGSVSINIENPSGQDISFDRSVLGFILMLKNGHFIQIDQNTAFPVAPGQKKTIEIFMVGDESDFIAFRRDRAGSIVLGFFKDSSWNAWKVS